jgi:hypothetical protein
MTRDGAAEHLIVNATGFYADDQSLLERPSINLLVTQPSVWPDVCRVGTLVAA